MSGDHAFSSSQCVQHSSIGNSEHHSRFLQDDALGLADVYGCHVGTSVGQNLHVEWSGAMLHEGKVDCDGVQVLWWWVSLCQLANCVRDSSLSEACDHA